MNVQRNFLQLKPEAVSVFLHVVFMVIKLPPWPRKNCYKLAFNTVSKLQILEYIYIYIKNPECPRAANWRLLSTSLGQRPFLIVYICKCVLLVVTHPTVRTIYKCQKEGGYTQMVLCLCFGTLRSYNILFLHFINYSLANKLFPCCPSAGLLRSRGI